MNEKEVSNEVNHWFSTYGVVTAERILGKYQIKIEQTELVEAIKTPTSLYHHLVKVPLRNVLNGIIFQQASDYHVYAQKLFIDYLLSGESAKDEESQGAATRETLENKRQHLVYLGDEFHKAQGQHECLIAQSQSALIKISQLFNSELEQAINMIKLTLKNIGFSGPKSQIRKAIKHALIYCNLNDIQTQETQSYFVDKMNEILEKSITNDLKEKILLNLKKIFQIESDFEEQIKWFIQKSEEISQLASSFRAQFYDIILRVLDLINVLPDYKIDPEQDAINREPLYFDNNIGVLG